VAGLLHPAEDDHLERGHHLLDGPRIRSGTVSIEAMVEPSGSRAGAHQRTQLGIDALPRSRR
jgi:hypothetical protein